MPRCRCRTLSWHHQVPGSSADGQTRSPAAAGRGGSGRRSLQADQAHKAAAGSVQPASSAPARATGFHLSGQQSQAWRVHLCPLPPQTAPPRCRLAGQTHALLRPRRLHRRQPAARQSTPEQHEQSTLPACCRCCRNGGFRKKEQSLAGGHKAPVLCALMACPVAHLSPGGVRRAQCQSTCAGWYPRSRAACCTPPLQQDKKEMEHCPQLRQPNLCTEATPQHARHYPAVPPPGAAPELYRTSQQRMAGSLRAPVYRKFPSAEKQSCGEGGRGRGGTSASPGQDRHPACRAVRDPRAADAPSAPQQPLTCVSPPEWPPSSRHSRPRVRVSSSRPAPL